MDFDTSFIDGLYFITVIAFLLIIILSFTYFSYKLKKQRIYYENKSNLREEIANELPLKMPGASLSIPASSKEPLLPYTTKEPFNEAENITLSNFSAFKGTRILMVEDNKLNQRIILSILQKSGINITVANHGEEALKFLFNDEKTFDLILMDISMPVMDGYATTQAIRKDIRFDSIPIMTFTAFPLGKEIEKMNTFGANGHITKPLNTAQLFTAFDMYLGDIKRNLSIIEIVKIKGLDVTQGIMLVNNNEDAYRQQLREFVLLYRHMIESIPLAIEKGNDEYIQIHIMRISNVLAPIGAYSLNKMVARMKKIFIYSTEHRIEEFKDIFPQALQDLMDAINLYLTHEQQITGLKKKLS